MSASPPQSNALAAPARPASAAPSAPRWLKGWDRSAWGLLLAVGLMLVGAFWERLRTEPPGPPYFPAEAWSEQSAGELRLKAPLALGPLEDQTARLEGRAEGELRSWKGAKGATADGAFQLQLRRIELDPKAVVHTDVLTASLLADVARRMGDEAPQTRLAPAAAFGAAGFRAACRTEGADPVFLEALGVRRGAVFWYVQTTSLDGRFRTDAAMVLDSVRFADETPRAADETPPRK